MLSGSQGATPRRIRLSNLRAVTTEHKTIHWSISTHLGAVHPHLVVFLKSLTSETIVVPFNDFAQLEEVIRKRNDISCVILEPIPANMGLVVPEKEYLNFIRKITLEKDIVLIFDEVVTGFRLGTGGASEFFGIKPDIVTFSKSVANGFSLATICGRRELLEQFAPTGDVYQASTYAGNPVAVTAAIATISALTRGQSNISKNDQSMRLTGRWYQRCCT